MKQYNFLTNFVSLCFRILQCDQKNFVCGFLQTAEIQPYINNDASCNEKKHIAKHNETFFFSLCKKNALTLYHKKFDL